MARSAIALNKNMLSESKAHVFFLETYDCLVGCAAQALWMVLEISIPTSTWKCLNWNRCAQYTDEWWCPAGWRPPCSAGKALQFYLSTWPGVTSLLLLCRPGHPQLVTKTTHRCCEHLSSLLFSPCYCCRSVQDQSHQEQGRTSVSQFKAY